MALRASVLGAFSALLLSSAATAQERPVVATASGPVRGVAPLTPVQLKLNASWWAPA